MADSIIDNVRLLLPFELRLIIYSFMFFVDLEALEQLQADRVWIRDHGLPPHAACLQEEAYLKYRRHPKHREAQAQWPDRVEEAFFKGDYPQTTLMTL